ncbi:MAG TPA: hypothetical protein VMS93_06710 [Candidatus Saccharimonadales bacterium]|nr:hypothetical protein [Candidatus Saccharimonadales bacterium]
MASLTQNIDALFDQVGAFEAGSKGFSVEAFTQNLKGIVSAFELLRNQPELGVGADDALYKRIREVEPSQSQLRFLAAHTLGMYLEAWAHGPSGLRRSYQDLLRFRPDDARVDADFIERVLVPRLLALRDLAGNADLGYSLLLELSSFMQTFGGPPSLPTRPTRAELAKLPAETLLLGFGRRRIAFPGKDLTETPDAWEYGLKREKFFEWLRDEGRRRRLDLEPYLLRLGLLRRVPWWRRLLAALGRLLAAAGAGLKAGFERLPAGGVFWSVFWVLLLVVVMVAVPVLWLEHYDHQVKQFGAAGADADTRALQVP